MSPFRSRSILRPTLGRLVLVLVLLGLAWGWNQWRHLRPRSGTAFDAPVQGTLAGRTHVADGDSLAIDGARIRLLGIDAPERVQSCSLEGMRHPCGAEAREHLAALVAGRPVVCDWTRLDKYGRRLARCRAGDVDLNARMVRDGWAVSYGAYEREEADARAHGRGLWSGDFVWPEDFRRDRRASGAAHFLGEAPDGEGD